MKSILRGMAVSAAALALAGVAHAGVTTITFNGIAAPGGFVSYGSGPLTLSGVTFTSNGSMFVIDPGFYSSSYAGGGFLNTDYTAPHNILTITLPHPTTSVSFDFGGLFGPVAFTAKIPSLGFATTVTTSDSITGTATLQTASLTTATAFSSLTITMPDAPNYNALDNFSFGAVPEPTSWAVMLIGLAAAGGAMRRQRTSLA